MFIKCYGLFWLRDEVDWTPRNRGGTFQLLGRQGKNFGTVRVADFRQQTGIYILYGYHGACYVGLAKKNSMGWRLKTHTSDHLADEWDRFSWFGFRKMLEGKDENGFRKMSDLPNSAPASPTEDITDVEALLIRAMGLMNVRQMNFTYDDPWEQIKLDEIDYYLEKL